MSFLDTLGQMGVLFTLVIIGFMANRCKIMNEQFDRSLSVLIINVTAPCIILSSVMGDKLPDPDEALPVFITGSAMLIVMLLAGIAVTSLMKAGEDAGIFRFMFAFGNINFIGLPVVTALFGNHAVFYVAVLTIPFNFLVFLLGQIFISSCRRDGDRPRIRFNWRIAFSPTLVSTYAVLLLVYFQIRTPKVLAEAVTLAGYMTVPASLMVIGSALAGIRVKDMLGTLRVYVMCLCKLLVIPVIIYFLYSLTPFDKKYTDVLVILSAMPVASYGTMLCLKEGVDPKTMAQGTFLSTLLSVVTIPLLSLIL